MSESIIPLSLLNPPSPSERAATSLNKREFLAVVKESLKTVVIVRAICGPIFRSKEEATTAAEKLNVSLFYTKGSKINRLRSLLRKKNIIVSQIEDDQSSFKKKSDTIAGIEEKEKTSPPPSSLEVNATLERLHKEGYKVLAQKLKGKSGYPWDSILRLNSPKVIEQLVDLYEVLELKKKKAGNDQQVNPLVFGLKIAEQDHPDVETILGQLIYLLHKDSDKLKTERTEEEAFIQQIGKGFQEEISKIQGRIKSYRKLHKTTHLQSSDIACRNLLTKELSHLLISNTGNFNFGIIPTLMQKHLPALTHSTKQKTAIAHALKLLAANPSLREKFHDIIAPTSVNAPANDVIRIAMDIPSTASITNLDAKKTVLTALLSNLRQGKEGSCFATPLAIVLLASHMDHCLADFTSLLASSKLTRTVDNASCDFPFMLSPGKKHLEEALTLTRRGTLSGEERAFIWEAPGIVAACKAIGINSPEEAIKSILFKKEFGTNDQIKITLKELFQLLVKKSKELGHNKEIGLSTLYLRATFSFESQETNPLLQVWGNAIAGMAEPDESGMLRSAIVSTILDAIKKKLKDIIPDASENRVQIKKIIRSEFNKRIHLQYDPIIKNDVAVDQNSTDGAFVLYDKNHTTKSDLWVRVDTPDAFRTFLSRTMEDVKKEIKEWGKKEHKNLNGPVNILSDHAATPEFIVECLNLYYHRNNELVNPLMHYQKIKYAPWVTKSGNNFSKVIQVYLEEFKASNSISLLPENAGNLLLKTIEIGKKQKLKCKESNSPFNLVPIRIPGVHAFNLMLSHPSLQGAYEQNTDGLEHWLTNKVFAPGNEIADHIPDKETRIRFLQEINKQLIPASKQDTFNKNCAQVLDSIPLKELRSNILQKIMALNPAMEITTSEVALQVDSILVNTLPENMVAKLRYSSIHFADTNWADGIQDIHFCFLVNPGSGELEIWASHEEKGKFFPLKQDIWLNSKEWEVFTDIV